MQAMHDASRGGIENVVAVLNGYWPPPANIVNRGVVPRFSLRDHNGAPIEDAKGLHDTSPL